MWTWLLTIVGSLIAAIVGIVLVNEFRSRSRAAFYSKQGFTPEISSGIVGFVKLIIKALEKDDQWHDLTERILEIKNQGSPGIVYNLPNNGRSEVWLLDQDLIREFCLRENDVSFRIMPIDIKLKEGFFSMAGNKALEQRVIFSEFFRIENLSKLIPLINKILEENFQVPRSDLGELKIENSKVFVEKTMIKIVNCLIFGENSEIPKGVSGLSFSEELVYLLNSIFSKDVYFNPLNVLSRGFANELNLLPKSREVYSRARELDKRLAEYILERINHPEKYKEERKQFSLINLMLDYNASVQEDKKLSMENMIGNCNVFLIAGYDTTANSVNSMIYNLSHLPSLQTKLREAVQPLDASNFTFQDIDQIVLLEKIVREAIRVNAPAPTLLGRELSVDFSMGKYKFRKGDRVSIPFAPLMWDPNYFPSEKKFDVDAINEQNKKLFVPFSLGKRNCVGQQLAQLEMKLFCAFISRHFTLKPLTLKSKYVVGFVMQVDDCQVQFADVKK